MNTLDIIIDGDNGKQTLRDYLKDLLVTLWKEEACFSGKRPFGNSGWQYDVYKALLENDVVEGKLDEDGYVEKLDTDKADLIITDIIKDIFKKA